MNKKNEHIDFALKQGLKDNDFDRIRFIHQSLPQVSINEVDLSSTFIGHSMPLPIYINAMTGGTDEAFILNKKLAKIAKTFLMPIATGSLSIALSTPTKAASFQIIREVSSDGIVLANIGANHDFSHAKKAIDSIEADGLQIHLNAPQEWVMPEGDRQFSIWKKNIASIATQASVPVIVKEVGFGMSAETMNTLKSLGVRFIDISGKGGTDFAWIENQRRVTPYTYFNDWGLSTVESLLEAKKTEGITIYASGGIRHPLDVVKALALGAEAVGLSAYFLNLVCHYSLDEALEKVAVFIEEIRGIIGILGCSSISDLRRCPLLFDLHLMSFMQQRNIHITAP